MQTRLRGKLIERQARELLGARGRGAASDESVAAVDARQRERNQGYKFWKMRSKRLAEGSAGGASEGDAGDGGAVEEEALAASSASLLVSEGQV